MAQVPCQLEKLLASIVQVDSGSTAVYGYDAEGRRVAKTASSAGGAFEYLYDLHGRAVTEMGAGTSNINRTEVYAGSRHVATQNVGLSTTYFMHSDWLGTKRVASGLSGTAMQTCTSLVYGDSMTCAGPFASPLNFTGQMRDAETQLVEFPARYYSPTQGRWYSPDWASAQVAVPYADLHNPQSLNLYDYVGGDPSNHADADGHECLNQTKGCDTSHADGQVQTPQGQAAAQTAQNQSLGDKVESALTNFAHAEADFFQTYIKEIDSAIPFSGVSSPSADNGVEKAAVGVGFVAGFVVPEGEGAKGSNTVYTIGKDAYVGITNSLERRAAEHGAELTKVAGGLTREGARGVEQALIEHNGLGKNGGTLTNKINSIAKSNPIYERAVQFGRQLLQSIGSLP